MGTSILARVLRRNTTRWGRRLRLLPVVGGAVAAVSHALWKPGKTTWVTVEGGPGRGLRIAIEPRYEHDIWQGTYEPLLLGVLVDAVGPGCVVYDVGAHIGFVALVAARRAAPGGIVYAFEPDPVTRARLEQNIAANPECPVEVVAAAAWSHTGAVGFASDPTHPTRWTSRVDGAGGLEVEAIALDDFAATRRPPSLVKLDVEGAELAALAGCRRILAEARPVVLCEVHPGVEVAVVAALLEASGYVWEELATPREQAHLVARPR